MSNELYTVYVDDNYHFMNESARYEKGRYEYYESAVKVCKEIVDDDLAGRYISGMSAADLYDSYKAFGGDPYIVPRVGDGFSAWGYAKSRCSEICRKP